MASIYLIRHGQASFNTDNYDRLSDLGRRQSRLTGEFLARSGVTFDAAYCGSLERQRHTGELILEAQLSAPTITEDSRLDEVRNDEHLEHLLPRVLEHRPELQALIDAGLHSSKRFQKIIEAVFNYWVSSACDEPAIQSWEDYSSRVHSVLRDIVATQGSGKCTAVFTSGGTIATIVAHVLGVSAGGTYQFYEPMFNCSVTQLFYSGDRISLSSFNDCSFLRGLAVDTGEELVTYR
jgi:broad specificity phosphatase PhoE